MTSNVKLTAYALFEDGLQNSPAIVEGVEVADAVNAISFETTDFFNLETGFGNANVDQGLDFETITVDVHVRQAVLPEGVVAVAKVGEVCAIKNVWSAC